LIEKRYDHLAVGSALLAASLLASLTLLRRNEARNFDDMDPLHSAP